MGLVSSVVFYLACGAATEGWMLIAAILVNPRLRHRR